MTHVTPITDWITFPYPTPRSTAAYRRMGHEVECQVTVTFDEDQETQARLLAADFPKPIPMGLKAAPGQSHMIHGSSFTQYVPGGTVFGNIGTLPPFWLVKIRYTAPVEGWETKTVRTLPSPVEFVAYISSLNGMDTHGAFNKETKEYTVVCDGEYEIEFEDGSAGKRMLRAGKIVCAPKTIVRKGPYL